MAYRNRVRPTWYLPCICASTGIKQSINFQFYSGIVADRVDGTNFTVNFFLGCHVAATSFLTGHV